MNCTLAQESLSQWIDGELIPNIETEMFAHLGGCETCRVFFKNLFVLNQELLSARAVQVPVSMDERILAKKSFVNFKPGKSWLPLGRTYSLRAVGFAVLLSVVTTIFISSFWYRNSQPQQTIVCLTPLPEVEVNGYVVVAPSPIKGINQ